MVIGVLQESLLTGAPKVQVGDLVVYEAPYYTTDGEGLQKIRRITGTRGSWLRLNCDAKTVKDQEKLIRAEEADKRRAAGDNREHSGDYP